MGYNTKFQGELKFNEPLTGDQLTQLESLLGKTIDINGESYNVDLQLSKDGQGLTWDGSEKTYSLESVVSTLIAIMQRQWPDFDLQGEMLAQGEEVGDLWLLCKGEDGLYCRKNLSDEGLLTAVRDAARYHCLRDKSGMAPSDYDTLVDRIMSLSVR